MASPVAFFIRVLDAFARVGAWLAAAALALIVLSYVYEVIARYFLNAPASWTAELVTYLICFGIFMMMPYVTARNSHVAVTILVDRLSPRQADLVRRQISLVGCAVCAAIVWITFQETSRQFLAGVRILAATLVPKWWISVWIVVGFLGAALQGLRLVVAGVAAEKPAADDAERC